LPFFAFFFAVAALAVAAFAQSLIVAAQTFSSRQSVQDTGRVGGLTTLSQAEAHMPRCGNVALDEVQRARDFYTFLVSDGRPLLILPFPSCLISLINSQNIKHATPTTTNIAYSMHLTFQSPCPCNRHPASSPQPTSPT
jgi:hypothetical protein